MLLPPTTTQTGLCSIILPIYNRAAFLSEAFASIQAQRFTRWELIVVDDGSTDDSAAVLAELAAKVAQPVKVVRQENAGAYAARAHGLRHTRGEFIAFYDSDDLWLPHHLEECVAALEANPEVDWVYGALRRVNLASGELIEPSDFHEGGRPRGFLQLHTRVAGRLKIIDDPRALEITLVGGGLRCSLQKSVIRRQVFERVRFRADLRNGEDRFFAFRALKLGCRFGYFDRVHLEYRVHEDHSSAAGASGGGGGLAKRLRISQSLVAGWSGLMEELALSRRERQALRQRLAREVFWVQGLQLYRRMGQADEAMTAFRRGLAWWPWNARMWKTYLVSWLRLRLRGAERWSAMGTEHLAEQE